jgi:hypothetical protein
MPFGVKSPCPIGRKKKGKRKGPVPIHVPTSSLSSSPPALRSSATNSKKNPQRKRGYADDGEDVLAMAGWKERLTRMAVAHTFLYCFHMPPEADWDGPGGTIAKVCKWNELDSGSAREMCRTTFRDVLDCRFLGIEYMGKTHRTGGQNKVIIGGTAEAQHAADLIEKGHSRDEVMHELNDVRAVEGKVHIGASAVDTFRKHTPHKDTKMQAKKQGNDDPESDWACGRYLWVAQLLIRFGLLTPEQAARNLYDLEPDALVALPRAFSLPSSSKLELSQVAWWDETHKKVSFGHNDRQIRFLRDLMGMLDEAGTLNPEEFLLKVKYPSEMRALPGCAMVEKLDVDDLPNYKVGLRAEPFFYTENTVLTIPKFRVKERERIAFIKGLKGNAAKSAWRVDPRVEGELFEGDDLTRVWGIAAGTKTALAALSIYTVIKKKIEHCSIYSTLYSTHIMGHPSSERAPVSKTRASET